MIQNSPNLGEIGPQYVKTISDPGISPDSAFRSTHYSTYGHLLRRAPIVGIEQTDISVGDTQVKYLRKVEKIGYEK
jgi:hypothetical protein